MDHHPSKPRFFIAVPNLIVDNAVHELQSLDVQNVSVAKRQKSSSLHSQLSSSNPDPVTSESAFERDSRKESRATKGEIVDPVAEAISLKRKLEAQLSEAIREKMEAVKEMAALAAKANRYQNALMMSMNRYTVFTTAYHEKHPSAAKYLWGLGTWAVTKTYMECFWPQYKPPPESMEVGCAFTMFEKLLMIKAKFQRRMSEETIALAFGVHRGTVNKWARKCSPMWGEMGRFLSILPLSEDYLMKQMPENFHVLKLDNVCGLVDGKDFQTETYRLMGALTKACFSEKVGHSAARFCSWTVPCGLACEHSPLFMARAGEASIVATMGEYLVKFPMNWLILADRGFYRDTFHYPNLNVHLTPSFLRGREQFSPSEVSQDRGKCEARYTSETSFSRVTDSVALQDVVPRSMFCYMQDMVDWGQANVNLGSPMQFPADIHLPKGYFDEAKERSKKHEEAKARRTANKKMNLF